MKAGGRDIAVCSWSLRPSSTPDLIAKVKQLGLSHVQVGLHDYVTHPLEQIQKDLQLIRDSGLTVTATSVGFPGEDYRSIAVLAKSAGFVPDETWPARRDLALKAGKITAKLGVGALEFHVGFIPSSSDPAYFTLVQRVREVAMQLVDDKVDLLMETGQATPSELLRFLNDTNCRNVAVNFDPANMLLYGCGDPIEAVQILSRHIQHLHVKDAVASSQPRLQWGTEVQLGKGQVDLFGLLDALDDIGYTGPLCVERESGDDRIGDILETIRVLRDAEGELDE